MLEPLDEDVPAIQDQPPDATDGKEIEISGDVETEFTKVDEPATTQGEKNKEKNGKTKQKKKKRKCSASNKWTYDDETLWRIYMMSFVDKHQRLKQENEFKKRILANLPKFPQLVSSENLPPQLECYPLNTFNQQYKTNLPNKLNRNDKIRMWRKMRSNPPVDILSYLTKVPGKVSKIDSDKWPTGVWPCIKRKLAEERNHFERIKSRKRMRILPCHLEVDNIREDEPKDDYADHKELGHARIPPTCLKTTKYLLVDRAAGENPGLVDGDYIMFELVSKKKGKRVYADVCLRGLKGMHIVELSPKRTRAKSWKFCFYQAIVALLAKTQLRYKYASSVNIDYIYDHAWMIFVHMGCINVRKKQRLDDVVVYNYKYSIELELVDELKDIPRITDVTWGFMEKTMKKQHQLERKELMHTPEAIDSEKNSIPQKFPVHKSTKAMEDWFDKLDIQHKNCVFRTPRFCLAFWKDEFFWYLYNPFRCNEFGFWDDCGYGCIMKFCSRDSLKRHLMILLLRAYIYESHFEEGRKDDVENEQEKLRTAEKDYKDNLGKGQGNGEENQDNDTEDQDRVGKDQENVEKDEESAAKKTEQVEPESKKDVFTIQIFQMICHCCKIHNIKLLQRGAPKHKMQVLPKKEFDACPEDDDSIELRDTCAPGEEESNVLGREKIEKSSWLKTMTITWARFSGSNKRRSDKDVLSKKLVWHQYYVEEERKLFSLWGQVHIKDQVFPEENRGKQSYACYVVCAGMTRLMAPDYWTPRTLDAILFCGDGYYTSSILEAERKSRKPELLNIECWSNYLSEYFKIGEFLFQARILPAICGKLYMKSKKYLWKALEQCFLKYRFGILTCENACLGIFKFCGAYYMFDAHSMGPPVFQYGTGTAYMLRATYFHKFITSLILTIGSPECSQFALNPIEILKIIDLDDIGCPEKNQEKMCREIKLKARCHPVIDEKRKKRRKLKNRTC